MRYLGILCCVSVLLISPTDAADVTWNGGDGFWGGSTWDKGSPPIMDGTDNAIIPSGTVTFDAVAAAADFLTMPGSDLTIQTGGEWTQSTTHWSRINGGLHLNGGSFTRTAIGNLTFGTNDTVPDNTTIDISVTNGGQLSINGELWFGFSADRTPVDLSVTMTINDGTVLVPAGGGASWWMWDDDVGNNSYAIDFTGPGVIQLGSGGIRPESAGTQVSYQALWEMGILQYNGSNATNFEDHFMVAGSMGQLGYSLLSGPLDRLSLEVNRETGNLTLSNQTTSDSFVISAYNLLSPVGALDPSQWNSIADGDSTWVEFGAAVDDMSEGTLGTISLDPGTSIDLGNAWSKSVQEDLQIDILGADGTYLDYFVLYSGNNGNSYEFGDLNFDGVISVLDWQTYQAGMREDLTGMSEAQAYQLGDLDNDGDNDLVDFGIFRTTYDAAVGPGAFSAMLAGVPEPTSMFLVMLGSSLLLFTSRSRRGLRPSASATHIGMLALASALLVVTSAQAQLTPILEYSFPASYDGDGTPTNGVITDLSTAGNNATMDTTDRALTDNRPPGFDASLMSISGSNGNHGQSDAIDLLNTTAVGAAGGFMMDIWFQWEGTFVDSRKLIDYAGTESLRTVNNELQFVLNSSAATTLSTPIGANTWHHAVAIFDAEGNQPVADPNYAGDFAVDGTAYLYLDDVLMDSAAVTKNGFGDSLDRPIGINRWGGGGGEYNQGMIFNPTISLGFETPAPPTLTLEVDTNSGAVALRNLSGESLDINAYEILSAGGALNAGGWNSLEDQNLFEFPAGDGTGNGWEESGTPDAGFLGEAYLLDDSEFVDGTTVNLGAAFNPAIFGSKTDGDLVINLRRANGGVLEGIVEYVMQVGITGDYNNSGLVEQGDLDLVLLNWGNPVPPIPGAWVNDLPTTPGIDQDDLDRVLLNWGNSTASAQAVPEPSSSVMLLLAGLTASGLWSSRRRKPTRNDGERAMKGFDRMRIMLVAAVGTCLLGGSSLMASVTNDREYWFGEDSLEGPSQGAIIGSNNSGGVPAGDTVDSIGPTGAYLDLTQSGSPTYQQVGPGGLARPGVTGSEFGVRFDGVDDRLSGISLNRPDEMAGPTPIGNGPLVSAYPFNYDGITVRGLQGWVYPDQAGIDAGGYQSIVFDTIFSGGPAINELGQWTQTNSFHPSAGVGQVPATASVAGDTWYHLMHHNYAADDASGPLLVPGTGAGRPFTSVLYVNGIAVSANNDNINTGGDAAYTGGLLLGVAENGGEPGSYVNYFQGVVDDLEMYVYGNNTSVGGQNYGTFDLFADNGWIADAIATSVPGGVLTAGDINRDGAVNGDGTGPAATDDVSAFVDGWKSTKTIAGTHNSSYVGDWETWGWGDLNHDGITDLLDWHVLRTHHPTPQSLDLNQLLLAAAVPEPSSAALLLGALVFLPLRRRRR